MGTTSNGAVNRYFLTVLLLSVPFWVAGAFSDWEPLPGIPLSALMVLVPALVAIGFVVCGDGPVSARRWLKEALSPTALGRFWWVLTAVLLPPAILAAAYGVMRVAGYAIPEPDVSIATFALLIAIFMIPALLEELGWCGFALAKLQPGMTAVRASLVIGVVWAAWHLIPLLQAGRGIVWIGWWCVATVALRVLFTWIYNNSAGSVLLAALCHASVNASWQSFPVRGSHYDPAIHAIVLLIVGGSIVAGFGARTLTREAPHPAR